MKTQPLGRALRDGCPYLIELCWRPPNAATEPLNISYGIGMGGFDSPCTLASLLAPGWSDVLQWCDCEWLHDLAREEGERKTLFTADEIWERARTRHAN